MKYFLLVTLLQAINFFTIAQTVNKKAAYVTGAMAEDLHKKPVAATSVLLINEKYLSLVAFAKLIRRANFSLPICNPAATGRTKRRYTGIQC